MLVIVRGHDLPARRLPQEMARRYGDVRVGLQVGTAPVGLIPADASDAEWRTDVEVVEGTHGRDFRGAAVHGKRGERFLYLTWGTVTGDTFTMFRRAKLMLGESPLHLGDASALVATVGLTDDKGLPRCARVRAPDITWALEPLDPAEPAVVDG